MQRWHHSGAYWGYFQLVASLGGPHTNFQSYWIITSARSNRAIPKKLLKGSFQSWIFHNQACFSHESCQVAFPKLIRERIGLPCLVIPRVCSIVQYMGFLQEHRARARPLHYKRGRIGQMNILSTKIDTTSPSLSHALSFHFIERLSYMLK